MAGLSKQYRPAQFFMIIRLNNCRGKKEDEGNGNEENFMYDNLGKTANYFKLSTNRNTYRSEDLNSYIWICNETYSANNLDIVNITNNLFLRTSSLKIKQQIP